MAEQFASPVVIGTWRNGRPIHLMQGGAPEDPPPADPPADPPAEDKGYPAGTTVEDMTDAQRAAYYKHYSRRHEDEKKAQSALLKKLGVTDDAAAQALLDKAKAADKYAKDHATDTERAAQGAREATERELRPQLAAQSVEDAFRLLIGDRKTDDETTDFLADLNLSRFIGENGRVDTAKVRDRANQFAPATGTQQQARKGPTATGHGSGSTGSTVKTSGSDLYDRMHPKKTA